MDLTLKLINWFADNQRDLPWRKDNNPYFIWLSEVLLQQTQVVQGLPYFNKFVNKFPKVEDLANASEEEVLRLWQGLGYYSRARNLHFAAKTIAYDYEGVFPNTFQKIKQLKGIGDYTAAAIASIAFNESVPTIDGNVLRVISRLIDLELPVDTAEGLKAVRSTMEMLIDTQQPGTFNQAVMELGALICKPKNPDCVNCPIHVNCLSFECKNQHSRPVKSKKTQIKNWYIDYLFLSNKKGVVLQQRDEQSIWKKMFEFPNVFSEEPPQNLKALEHLMTSLGCEQGSKMKLFKEEKHQLTHRKLHLRFFVCPIPDDFSANSLVLYKQLDEKPMPKPIVSFLNQYLLK
ncbi:MAG: A/G-specific adenine glycosylase [Bacteroidales bacterium]|nr:A/G-specific adenine glycosylase [Bacteroidales bacterium]